MTTLREAAQAALPWLEAAWDNGPQYAREFKPLWAVITDLRAALAEFDASLTDPTKISVHQTAEPAQPVAWYVERRAPGYGDDGVKSGPWWSKNEAKRFADDHHVLRPLYAAPQPPADVPLMTEGDCDSLIAATEGQDFYVRYRLLRLIRAVEAEVRRRCGVVG